MYKHIAMAISENSQNLSMSCRPFDIARVQQMCAHPFVDHAVYRGDRDFTRCHRYAMRIHAALTAMPGVSFDGLVSPEGNDFSVFMKNLQRVAVQSETHFFAVSDVLLKESFVFELERNFEEVLERLVPLPLLVPRRSLPLSDGW